MSLSWGGAAVSRPELAPHQSAAVQQIHATLSRYPGVLLADEVGLGKSWIAATVAGDFQDRGEGVELIVPRALEPQWRVLLKSFDVAAEVMTHDSLHGKFAFPGAAGPELLVIDEAHRFRNPATNRYRALSLRSLGRRLLLVTATPICNRLEDLRALIDLMVADDAMAWRGVCSIERAFEENRSEEIAVILEELVIRRTGAALPRHLQPGALHRQVVRFHLPQNEDSIRAQMERLRFPLIASEPHHAILGKFLWRRLESGLAAFRDSLRRQLRFYRRALEWGREGRSLTKMDYRRIFGADQEEVLFQELLFRELWAPPGPFDAGLARRIDDEMTILEGLDALTRDLPDAKAELLLEVLGESCSEQILIFAAALATARDLFRRIAPTQPAALVSSQLHWLGSMRRLSFEQVLESFRRGEARVLILTDLGAEGLNLQNASVVVHYDLPWNPVRLEQRDGRIHRIGQTREAVRALYFLPHRRSDRLVMRRLAAKNRMRRRIWSGQPSERSMPSPQRVWSSLLLRARLTRRQPQVKMLRRLDRDRTINATLGDLLCQRYRIGAEMVIGQVADEFLDFDRLAWLQATLQAERSLSGSPGAGEIVESD